MLQEIMYLAYTLVTNKNSSGFDPGPFFSTNSNNPQDVALAAIDPPTVVSPFLPHDSCSGNSPAFSKKRIVHFVCCYGLIKTV